jgi:hypothetical protein
MIQLWTPLAKAFGVIDVEETAQLKSLASSSNWPQIYVCFEEYANKELLPLCRKHHEVSPDDVMSIRRLVLQSRDVQLESQVNDWRNHGHTGQLMAWIINGPWKIKELQEFASFKEFRELHLESYAGQTTKETYRRSAYYDSNSSDSLLGDDALHIFIEYTWVPRPQETQPQDFEVATQAIKVSIEDAEGCRELLLKGSLFIFGQPRFMSWPNGQKVQLLDGQEIGWRGEAATYVAIKGHYVSGMQLAIRSKPKGLDFQDLNSSNGTSDGSKILQPFVWYSGEGQQKFYLGGSPQDSANYVPRLRTETFLSDTENTASEPTPLRPQESPFKRPQLERLALTLEGTNGWRKELWVDALPIFVGRDADCEVWIPPEFIKVSRRHLIIKKFNQDRQAVLIEDISTHGLMVIKGNVIEDPRDEAWFEVGSQIIIGASQSAPALLLTFGL